MFRLLTFLGLLGTTSRAVAGPACSVCTIAIGASLSVARSMGVDDCIVGVWAGALLAIIGYWLIRWFNAKNWHFVGRDAVLMTLSIATVGFIYISELEYDPTPILFFYIDSFLFAALLGAGTFIGMMNVYAWMKARNGGHAHFPFEKVVLPVLAVFVVSLLFHFFPLCNCHGDI